MLRSQAGPGASHWMRARPTCPALTIRPVRMQVALRRRLRWPMPLGPRQCNGPSCRRPLDPLGDHWTSCTKSGRIKRRARPYERMWARVCREAGARVLENVPVREMGLAGVVPTDGRRLEIVATGLPLHRGVPLALDASIVAPLHADGRPWPHAARRDGAALARAAQTKDRTYPELVGSPVVRLVTVACETGGRLCAAARDLLRGMATARARAAPTLLRRATAAAWLSRWTALLSVSVQDALASTLVDDAPLLLDGADAEPPTLTDVWVEGLRG